MKLFKRGSEAAGAVAGSTVPFVAVALTSELTGLAGGAAVMKTLAVAGAVVGGGAVVGIAVVGGVSVAVALCVTKLFKQTRSAGNGQS